MQDVQVGTEASLNWTEKIMKEKATKRQQTPAHGHAFD